MSLGIKLAEAGMIPDVIMRKAIKKRHRNVLEAERPKSAEKRQEVLQSFLDVMAKSPVAVAPFDSNIQHYEVPAAMFEQMLGPYMKYSACLWPENQLTRKPRTGKWAQELEHLSRAEEKTLELTGQRALLGPGQKILDLGCGWGSFSLWAAEKYPSCRILAVSNSKLQKDFIDKKAQQKKLNNLKVITSDMNTFFPLEKELLFDRVVSVEMFEHMRNWSELLRRISGWLSDDGLFFIHIFVHKDTPYFFKDTDDHWMGKYFFTGGMMPSDSLLLYLQNYMIVQKHWRVGGLNYARTLNSWLALFDARREKALRILTKVYGSKQAELRFRRWRIFLLACAELFAFAKGNEWLVSHFLMSKRSKQWVKETSRL